MARKIRSDSRFASAFATLVCAWAIALVVLGLSTSPRPEAGLDTPAVVTAAESR